MFQRKTRIGTGPGALDEIPGDGSAQGRRGGSVVGGVTVTDPPGPKITSLSHMVRPGTADPIASGAHAWYTIHTFPSFSNSAQWPGPAATSLLTRTGSDAFTNGPVGCA